MNEEDIDFDELSKLKKQLGVAEDNNDYVYIKGIGFAWETGKLNLEGLIKELLKSKYITDPKFRNDENRDKDNKKEE